MNCPVFYAQIRPEGNQINSVGSGISVEKSSAPSSSNVHTDSQFTHLPSSSLDIEYLKKEPESDELQKLAPSNSVIESNISTPLGLGFGGLQTKVMQTAPSIYSGFMLSFFNSDLHHFPSLIIWLH